MCGGHHNDFTSGPAGGKGSNGTVFENQAFLRRNFKSVRDLMVNFRIRFAIDYIPGMKNYPKQVPDFEIVQNKINILRRGGRTNADRDFCPGKTSKEIIKPGN